MISKSFDLVILIAISEFWRGSAGDAGMVEASVKIQVKIIRILTSKFPSKRRLQASSRNLRSEPAPTLPVLESAPTFHDSIDIKSQNCAFGTL